MSRIDALIFDCDGVLFESHAANLAYYNRIFKRFNYPPVLPEQAFRAHLCHTASSPVVLAELMSAADLPLALSYAASIYYREFIPFMQPEPHLQQMLEKVAARYPLAVATNRGVSVEPILEHFGLKDYFSVVVTCRDVEQPKPAPDMLLLAAEKLQVAPEKCLFIGDSELDQQAASGAQVRFAAYGGLDSGLTTLASHLQLLDYLQLD